MSLNHFHPAVAAWFARAFEAPTEAQRLAWPAIRSGRHTLVAAPTGSGKTLTAFLDALDRLVVQALENGGELPDATQVVYVSPLKALSNDIRLNLEQPLAGIRQELVARGLPEVEIRTAVRTGDTPAAERTKMARRPPHVLVTTPESLYVLLGSESGRRMLSSARELIVDEIHAMAASKRGSHLALSLERLDALCGAPLTRIGLSATQKPIEEVARFLVGTARVDAAGRADCHVVDLGHSRARDLAIEVPPVPLTAVMSGEAWDTVYARVAELVLQHRTTLVFVNTRRMAERAARHLAEKLGPDAVAAHHGSLSKEHRLSAERRLKQGELRVLVATASLELGIDIGEVDLVSQLGSPRSISALLQRVGRSGHFVGGTPRGRLFPATRDELVECAALLDAVRRGELDQLRLPEAPVDVLAQQIVAEVAAQEWSEDALHALFTRAWPYRALARADFAAVVRMLAEGYTTRRGPRGALLHRDSIKGRLRGRRGARTTAVTSGGTIPDLADYQVVLEPQSITVGSVNEDFAIESLAGDIFQLGNTSYRVLRVERDRIRVEDAHGAPPSIPFWLGEAPGRSDALSAAVSRLREEIGQRLDPETRNPAPHAAAHAWLRDCLGLPDAAAQQLVAYIAETRAALGLVPTQSTLVLERFFDESGGTQLVIHSPHGSRLNRAWGLALRKRFCRQFNFELQAAATEDAIVLSLSTSHSFPLIEVARYLHSSSATHVLTQALLDAPLFTARWRWNATTSLALPRFFGGKKVPAPLQRMKSEDLLATVFPDQVACAENLAGEREVPDHPLVQQTVADCLQEAMDLEGLLALLRRMEAGEVAVVARELAAPSPMAAEVLNAAPYAFLDDAPLEERRTRAVQDQRHGDRASIDRFGALDPTAIEAVREQAWPDVRDADEMHEALVALGFVTGSEAEAPGWRALLAALAADGRAACVQRPRDCAWTAIERFPQLSAVTPDEGASAHAPATRRVPAEYDLAWEPAEALRELLRARLTGLGPVTVARLAGDFAVPQADIDAALAALQSEGYAVQGRFTPGEQDTEWCERHLLARIHRYTLGRLRREIEPVAAREYLRFLAYWQHLAAETRMQGPEALPAVLARLEGWEAPAGAWESQLLAARIADYSPHWLDDLSLSGRAVWTRLGEASPERGAGALRGTPIVLLPRSALATWSAIAGSAPDQQQLSSRARKVHGWLAQHGASFFDEALGGTQLLHAELEDALSELVARGLVSADGFNGLRALLVPSSKRPTASPRQRRRALVGIADAGRWALTRRVDATAAVTPEEREQRLEHVARVLLARYGVVGWRLLQREAAWLPRWRDLLRVWQRLEARGEIRGGRFIAGLSGEQFALPEAVALLKRLKRDAPQGQLLVVSGADPVNLVGTLLPGSRVPRQSQARVAYRDGVPVGSRVGGAIQLLQPLDPPTEAAVRDALLRGRSPQEPALAAPVSAATGQG